MEMHIGHLIKEVFDRQGRRATWFASELNCNRANVYNIFNRDNIDVEMLIKISRVLGHNFLRDIAPLADCPKSLDKISKNSIQFVKNLNTSKSYIIKNYALNLYKKKSSKGVTFPPFLTLMVKVERIKNNLYHEKVFSNISRIDVRGGDWFGAEGSGIVCSN